MKYFWMSFVWLVISCQQNDRQIIQLQKQVDSLKTVIARSYKPGFGDLMNTVNHHFQELYRAGQTKNWRYATFEIHEMQEVLKKIITYQAQRKETTRLKMIFPSLQNMTRILKNPNQSDFDKAYNHIQNTCNACHKLTGYDFIKITTPR